MSPTTMQMVGFGTMCLAAGIGLGAVGFRLIEAIADRRGGEEPDGDGFDDADFLN